MFRKILSIFLLILGNTGLVSAFEASYYADSFEGGMTANGTTFSQSNHTASICYEELSQLAYVSTAHTGMVVTLTDRPNCVQHTDRIDLSSSVFSAFAPLSKGLITDISATPLVIKTGKFVKRNFSQKEFSNLGIELSTIIANTYFTGDSIYIQGRVLDGKSQAIIFLVGKESGKQIVDAAGVDKNGKFSFTLSFPDSPEEFLFVISSGNYANTLNAVDLRTFSKQSLAYPDIPIGEYGISNPTIQSTSELTGIRLPSNVWGRLSINQKNKVIHTSQGNFLSFSGTDILPGIATARIEGYTLSSPSSLDISQYIPYMFSGTVLLDREREPYGRDKISLRTTKTSATFRFRLASTDKVRSSYYLTLPSGDVRQYEFPQKFNAGNGLLKTGIWITGTFSIRDYGVYKFELVQQDGFAYVNIPLYQGRIWSVIKKISDSEMKDVSKNISTVRTETFNAINSLRSSLGRAPLIRDEKLDFLAQKKAEYMQKNDDLNHITRDGRDIGDFARELGINTGTSLGENIAGGRNVSWLVLQDGLEESGSHRQSMINPKFTRVGVGYLVVTGKSYMVHVFSN